MSLWLELFLAGTVALVLAGALGTLWLVVDRLRQRPTSGPSVDGDSAPPVVRGGLDYRDHPGPVVERRGPDVTERRYRDAVDRTSGQNPRT
ncbi:hypothetical protein MWU75_08195 [Ornithinimicrobium sp. F0845]|uniref:hypothetical protein n=1 Tax=Ornithinimicrobium sp. F0845 TaxID=2926412 RepID=UPI001FF32D5F|nr:hypothetical protein [Ornithinimicrobium sp. F0845]MCK0112114.1 hypothetical protein [Ornithinimicrobium sp. F0845]